MLKMKLVYVTQIICTRSTDGELEKKVGKHAAMENEDSYTMDWQVTLKISLKCQRLESLLAPPQEPIMFRCDDDATWLEIFISRNDQQISSFL